MQLVDLLSETTDPTHYFALAFDIDGGELGDDFFLFGLGRIRRNPEERIHYLLGATIWSRIIKGIMLVFAQNIAASFVAIGLATILDFAQSLLVVLIVAVMLITVQVFIECIIGVIAFRRYANA